MIITDEELKISKRVARKMAARWEQIDWEDLNSHLNLWLCENQRALERWRNEEGGMGKLSVALTREASKYASKEQRENNGGQLYYDIAYNDKQVEAILPFIWEYSGATMQRVVAEHPSLGTPIVETSPLSGNTFDDAIAILADVSSVYYDLPKADQIILALRYREDLPYKKIGTQMSITDDTARKRVERAIKRISEKLNKSTDIDSKYRNTRKDDWND